MHCHQWPLAVVVTFAFLICRSSAATACENTYTMRFKPVSDPGIPSYITTSSTEVPVYPFVNMPSITVYFTLQAGPVDLTLDGTLVQAVASPLLRLGGAAVQLTQGQAIFRALQVQQFPTDANQVHVIEFRVTVPFGNATKETILVSPPLRFLTQSSNLPVVLAFGNYGTFFRPGQTMELPINTTLPTFSLRLVDALGYLAPTRHAVVSLRYGDGTLGITVSPSTVNMTGTTDIRTFQLVHTRTATTLPTASLVLEARVDGSTAVTTLQTGTLTLTDPAASPSCLYIDFDSTKSFFQFNNIGNTAVLETALPAIVIRCLTSAWTVDTGASGIVITASASGAELEGNAALVLNGYATFADLRFVSFAPESVVISFTATFTSGSSSVTTIRTLVSGAISVSKAPIKSRHLSFATDSTVQEEKDVDGGTMYVRMGQGDLSVKLPLLAVAVLDSAYQPDYSASGVVLSVSILSDSTVAGVAAPSLSFPLTQNTLTVAQGVGTISDLEINVDPRLVGTSFTVRIEDLGGIRPRLDSAPMRLIASVSTDLAGAVRTCHNATATCALRLAFASAPTSYVVAEGLSVTVTVGAAIPEVRVYVKDQAGVLPPSSTFPTTAGTLYAFTGDTPEAEQYLSTGTNLDGIMGVWKGTYFSFPCLQLAKAPTRLIRLLFGMYYQSQTTGGLALASGIAPLRTGFLTVATDTTGNFDFKFVNSDSSHYQYAGQSGFAVIGVALPVIKLQVVDSLGRDDASATGLFVGVSSSTGTVVVNGGVVPIVKGVATFSTLRITTRADAPVLTFTVQANAAYPSLSRKSISTGRIALAPFPITAAYIAVRPVGVCPTTAAFACVSHAHEAMAFATFAEALVFARIGVRDSSNEWTTSDNVSLITLEATSDEAQIGGTLQLTKTVDSTFEFDIAIVSLKAAYTGLQVPVYLRFRVVQASAKYPALVGSAVVVGPITISALTGAGSSSLCSGAASAPVVAIKLYAPIATARSSAYLSNMVDVLAYTMGVETSRLTISGAPRVTAGVRTDTTRWEGSRLDVQFSDPTPTSSNRDSASVLAAALVDLRPDCQAPALGIASIFYASDERGCVASSFREAVSSATVCATRGFYTACQCFQDNVVSPMGVVCSIDVVVRGEFSDMCQRLANCQQSEIVSVCAASLENTSSRYIWAFGAFGGVVGLAVVVYLGVKRVLLRPAAVQLHRD